MFNRIGLLGAAIFSVTLANASLADASKSNAPASNPQYIELSGAEAADFLVGNSVIIRNALRGDANSIDHIYYFQDRNSMYVCGMTIGSECFLQPWSVKNDVACIAAPDNCTPFHILKSTNVDGFASDNGRIGVFVEYSDTRSDIVKGNWTDALRFDPRGDARRIELSDAEIAKTAEPGPDTGHRQIKTTNSASLIVGNTFLSDDQRTRAKDQGVSRCPVHGRYFAPGGRIVDFTCTAWPNRWRIALYHWRVISGLLCTDGDGEWVLSCGDRTIFAVPSSADRHLHTLTIEDGDKLVGYVGNVFHFQFDDSLTVKTPREN